MNPFLELLRNISISGVTISALNLDGDFDLEVCTPFGNVEARHVGAQEALDFVRMCWLEREHVKVGVKGGVRGVRWHCSPSLYDLGTRVAFKRTVGLMLKAHRERQSVAQTREKIPKDMVRHTLRPGKVLQWAWRTSVVTGSTTERTFLGKG